MRKLFIDDYNAIISTENLLEAWKEFVKGKRNRGNVQEFEQNLMTNIFALNRDLVGGTYRHFAYEEFNISDPKPRIIHKACVRDRLLHRALYRILYPFFETKFIADSFSCQLRKGTHRALNRFRSFYRKASYNGTRTCWVLKCDIRKFFANIDHDILMGVLKKRIADQKIIWLLQDVIGSFEVAPGIGLPLGNLTSQLFANVYMNEFDQFVKHELEVKRYVRYADDFVFLSTDRRWLEDLISRIDGFLQNHLRLQLHPNKVYIKTIASGVDFLGWVNFPDHRVLRTATKKRMLRRIRKRGGKPEVLQSYLGLLSHGNTRHLRKEVLFSSEL